MDLAACLQAVLTAHDMAFVPQAAFSLWPVSGMSWSSVRLLGSAALAGRARYKHPLSFVHKYH